MNYWTKLKQKIAIPQNCYPPVVAATVAFVSLIIYLFTSSVSSINSDAAAPFNLAREMLRTGEFFPDGWIGSTGIFHFNYAIWLCLHFTSDYLLAKSMAELLYTCIFVVSVILLSRWTLRNNSWLLILPVFLTCLSFDPHYEILFVQCAYTNVMFLTFFTVACFSRSVKHWDDWVIHRKWAFLAAALLLFSCLFGIVLVQALLIPLCGSYVLMVLRAHKNDRTVAEIKAIAQYIPYLAVLAAAGCIGFGVSSKITELSGVVGNSGVTTFIPSLDDLILSVASIFQGILCYVLFPSGTSLFSLNGILGLLRVLAVVALVIVFPALALGKFNQESKEKQFFLLFVILHVAEVLIIMILCGPIGAISAGRYLISSILLLMVVGLNYIYEYHILRQDLLSWLYSIGISLIAVICMYPVWLTYPAYLPNLAASREITDFLQEHELEFGYASFWNAGRNTILSNGEVQISGVIPVNNVVSPYYWLTSKDWYEPDFYTGRSFLMLTSGEIEGYAPNGYEATQLGNPDEILTCGDYTILVYDYNIANNNFTKIQENNSSLPNAEFQHPDNQKNYLDGAMSFSDPTMQQEDGSVSVAQGQVLYGPYIDLVAGQYTLKLELEGEATLRVTAQVGEEQLLTQTLTTGFIEIPFTLDIDKTDVEFVIETSSEVPTVVRGIYLNQN